MENEHIIGSFRSDDGNRAIKLMYDGSRKLASYSDFERYVIAIEQSNGKFDTSVSNWQSLSWIDIGEFPNATQAIKAGKREELNFDLDEEE